MQFEPAMIGLIVPVIIFTIPIVAILTSHQQKMAKIIHEKQNYAGEQRQAQELAQLRSEIQELKSLVHQQAIAMDSMLNIRPPIMSSVEERLGSR